MNLIPEYTGDFASGRFSGTGTYDVEGLGKYTGEFANGKFHGYGTLYVKGGKYDGEWEDGVLISGGFIFEDGLEHQRRQWEYCTPTGDRRFYREILENVPEDGPLKYETPCANPPMLPSGCYDLIYGYFDPTAQKIKKYNSHEVIRDCESKEEIEWITKNCRKTKTSVNEKL